VDNEKQIPRSAGGWTYRHVCQRWDGSHRL